MRENPVSFPCGELRLEGLCYFPEGDGLFPAVVICHPHPLYGGSMLNNVTMSVSSALAEKSMVAFMFNFRGVGGSQGRYGKGIAEQYDVAAAIEWLIAQPEVDCNRVGLAGYSFGATVALPAACTDDRVKAVALISMPPGPSQMTQLKGCPRPKLMISGTEDFVLPLDRAKLMNQEAAEPKQFELVDGADHFWMGYEAELAEKVVEFFKNKL